MRYSNSPNWLQTRFGEALPSIRGKALLYFGDPIPIEEKNSRIEKLTGERIEMKLPLWKSAIVTCWFPAIVTEELCHYAMARMLGLNVQGTVLFAYSTPHVGAVQIQEPDGIPEWKRQAVYLAPMLVSVPIAYYTLRWAFAASEPSHALVGLVLGSGFVFASIPDQLRDWVFEKLDW